MKSVRLGRMRVLGLLAGGAFAGHLVTGYVLENSGTPLERVERSISSLADGEDHPRYRYPELARKCDKAWNALAAFKQSHHVAPLRVNAVPNGNGFLHAYAYAQIDLKCTTQAEMDARKAFSAPVPL